MPDEFGSWNSVYKRFARWSDAEVWQRVFAELCKDADFEGVFIDSTIVRAHQHAVGAPQKRANKPLGVRVVGWAPKSMRWSRGWGNSPVSA